MIEMDARVVDDVEVWDREKQKQESPPEVAPLALGIEQPDEKVGNEEYADPELEGHVGMILEEVDIVECVESDPYDKHSGKDEDDEIEKFQYQVAPMGRLGSGSGCCG